MSQKDNLLQRAVDGLREVLSPVIDAFEDPELRKALLEAADLRQPAALPPPAIPQQSLDSIEAYSASIDPDLEAFYNLVHDLLVVGDAVHGFVEAAVVAAENEGDGAEVTAAVIDEYFQQITSKLTLEYLRHRQPFTHAFMRLVGLIDEHLTTHYTERLFVQRLGNFFADAGGYLANLVGDRLGLDDEEDARELASALFFPAAVVFGFILGKHGLQALYKWDADPTSTTPEADVVSNRMLTLALAGSTILTGEVEPTEDDGSLTTPPGDTASGSLTATFAFVPREHQGPGLFFTFGGDAAIRVPLGQPDAETPPWTLTIEVLSATAASFFIPWEEGATFGDNLPGGPSELEVTFTLERAAPASRRWYIPGKSRGTRLEFGALAMQGRFRVADGAGGPGVDFDIKALARDSALVIASGDGDAFVRETVPSDDVHIEMDLGLGLAKRPGGTTRFYLEGGDGLQVTLPTNKRLGPIEIQQAFLAVVPGTGDPAGIDLEASTALAARLGPVTVTLDRIGFDLAVREADGSGTFGNLDLGLGFKPPSGVGIAIDAAAVKGGGYLFFDPAQERYAGVVQLKLPQLNDLIVNAVGLLTTRMPDGSDGFSLLLMITAENFTAINVGLGFKLTGIGGLLGINRTVAVDVLAQGLKKKTLDAVLFPEDPVRNAPLIVSTMQSVFPAAPDQYIIAPVAQLTWGQTDLFEAEVGLAVEFPDPTRIVLMGQFRAQLPSKQKKVVDLKLDALGVVDFDKGEAMLLATLYKSKVLGRALQGDAAMLVRWSGDRTFIFSIGGFHPNFTAPSSLPKLSRLSLALTRGDNPKLRLELYLAFTSNTAQFGARAELFVAAAGFSVDGHLGFDTLFQFDPFEFNVLFSAGVALRWHGHTLAGVTLKGSVTGPGPVHVEGKATFKIWRFSKSINFDRTFGEAEEMPALPVVDPLPALLEALADARNWEAALPARGQMLVSLREGPGLDEVLVHPLGDLVVRQQVVPLGKDLDRYGNARLGGARRFTIDGVLLDAAAASATPVQDPFAPGQYEELSIHERLSRPSFEPMQSGIRIETNAVAFGGQEDAGLLVATTLDYETQIISDAAGVISVETPYTVPPGALRAQASLGASGRAALHATGAARYRSDVRGLQVEETRYVVADVADLQVVEAITVTGSGDGAVAPGGTYSAMLEQLRRYVAKHPEARGTLQIVAAYEAENTTS